MRTIFLTTAFVLLIRSLPGHAQEQNPDVQPPKATGQVEERGVPGPPGVPPNIKLPGQLPGSSTPAVLPDVTAIIDQNRMNNNLQYKAQIRIVNNGHASMPAVQVQTLGVTWNPTSTAPPPSQCVPNQNCAIKDSRTIGPLAPGQLVKYSVDPKFLAVQTVIVQVTILCNPPNNCLELNVANNKVQKILGPH
jgi:hypothetical protein